MPSASFLAFALFSFVHRRPLAESDAVGSDGGVGLRTLQRIIDATLRRQRRHVAPYFMGSQASSEAVPKKRVRKVWSCF